MEMFMKEDLIKVYGMEKELLLQNQEKFSKGILRMGNQLVKLE